MGSFDCYCAFCGGPLGVYILVGNKNAWALAKRRIGLEIRKRKLAGENVDKNEYDLDIKIERQDLELADDASEYDSAVVGGAEEVVQSEGNPPKGYMIQENAVDDGSIHNNGSEDSDSELESINLWTEEDDTADRWCYDPFLITKPSIRWLKNCYCLCLDTKVAGLPKAFLSERGTYDNYGQFRIGRRTLDSNAPNGVLFCYKSLFADQKGVFPLHMACFSIFARCIGVPDVDRVDKDALYRAMSILTGRYDTALTLDYGNITGMSQCWDSISGEEYSVIDPRTKKGIIPTLKHAMPVSELSEFMNPLDLARKVHNDPFAKLSYDIIILIISDLSVETILSLASASYHILTSTRARSFWTYLLHQRIIPWFWELKLETDEIFLRNLNPKRVYLWLDHATKPTLGMRGPFMGIANRRRIWNACEGLVPVYRNQTHKEMGEDFDNKIQ